jgi:hypothetical protein
MRLYLYILEEDHGPHKPLNLYVLYALDDEDARHKAKRRIPDMVNWTKVHLRRSQGHFKSASREYPPYIDMEEGQHV